MLLKKLLSTILLSTAASLAYASAPDLSHVIVAPNCLLKSSTIPHETLAKSKQLSLIRVNQQGLNALIDARTLKQQTPCGGFINVTADWTSQTTASQNPAVFLKAYETPPAASLKKINYAIQYKKIIDPLLATINPQDIWQDLTQLTQFQDRYANSNTGLKAAEWVQTQINNMVKVNNRHDVSLYTVATGNYKQPSVVMKIGGSNEPGIVVGAHLDTLSGSYSAKPGADDDGSGSSSLLQVARSLLSSGLTFKKPIYIIWYSAEEMGMVGSGYVVKNFKAKKITVDAVMQMDMTGYEYKNDSTIWLITDNTNANLTNYLASLVNTYVKVPTSRTQCGYACSDHVSWDRVGVKASFPFESNFNSYDPYIHSSQDTMDKVSLNHMTDFAKLGVAFAVELAEPAA